MITYRVGTKIIVLLRNPIDRAYSNYFLGVRMGDEQRSFDTVVEEEIKQINQYDEVKIDQYIGQSYLGRGLYAKELDIWFKYFPKNDIKILKSEDFADKTQEIMNEIFGFLNLPPAEIKNLEKKNVAEYTPMKVETRKKLMEFFLPYNDKLYDMLKVDYNWC